MGTTYSRTGRKLIAFKVDLFAFLFLQQLACHSEHTYLYAQSVLSSLANDAKSMIVRRIAEEIELHARAKYVQYMPMIFFSSSLSYSEVTMLPKSR